MRVSGGGLLLGSLDGLAIAEADAVDDLGQALGAVQPAPVALGALGELEDHRQRGLARQAVDAVCIVKPVWPRRHDSRPRPSARRSRGARACASRLPGPPSCTSRPSAGARTGP